MKPIIKVIIAVLLLLCLADMPYGFYELVRFAAAAAFAYLSYDYFKSKKDGLCRSRPIVSTILQSGTRTYHLEFR